MIDLFQKENKKLMIDGMVEAGIRVSRWAHAQGRDSDMVPPPDARVQQTSNHRSQTIPISKSIIANFAESVFVAVRFFLFFLFFEKKGLNSPQLAELSH